MSEVLIFAGTLEGRTIAEFLSKYHIETYVCVATQYGEKSASKRRKPEDFPMSVWIGTR